MKGQLQTMNAQPPSGCIANCRLFREDPDDEPLTSPELKEAQAIIASDLGVLSYQQRQEILHDIHGVSDIPLEEPSFVAMCKNELETNLMRNLHRSEAFQIVWNNAPRYVRSLYIMCLRCDSFDVKKAADRVRCHFDTKLWLFGIEKLCRDITLDDFDNDDMACYKAGFFQILPLRDRAGRVVQIKLWKLQKFKYRENVWRQLWYNHMMLLKDEETQRKGLVQIVYNINDRWRDNFDRELYMGVGKIRAATPIRVVAVHYCFSDPAFGVIIKLVTTALEMHTRTRTRLHQGSDMEVQYELQGFGIPIKQLPVNSEGKFKIKDHLSWIRGRRTQETFEKFSNYNTIIVPTHADVLYGRGKTMQNHIGNLRFANILEEEIDRYMEAKRKVKLAIANEIVESITKTGGRFLRQDRDGLWEEVDAKAAADKVGHGFRNRKQPGSPRKPSTSNEEVSAKRVVSPLQTQPDQPKTVISQQYVATKRVKQDFENDNERDQYILPVALNPAPIVI